MSKHYGRGDLAAKILEALRTAGKDPNALTTEDLAPVDQLHARGREATLELARLAGVTVAMPDRPLPLGLHLVLGEALGEMFRNQARNLEERRISIHQAVFERP